MSKKVMLTSVIALLVSGPLSAEQAQIIINPELYFTQPQPSSTQRLSIAASVLKDMVNPGADWIAQWDPALKPDTQTLATVDGINRDYQARVSRDQRESDHYSRAGYIIEGGLLIGSMANPTGIVETALKTLGSAGLSKGSGDAINELKKHGEAQTSEWLGRQLVRLRDAQKLTDLSAFPQMSPQQRLDWFRKENIIDQMMDASVKPEDRHLVEGMALRVLDDRLKKGIEIQGVVDADQDQKIEENAKQIKAVSRTLNQFREDTGKEFKNVYKIQSDLQGQLSGLATRTDQNASDIEFMQNFMYSNMSPEEQLSALNGGFFASMSAEERAKKTAQVELVKKRQDLTKAVATYGDAALTLSRIADKVGVDKNVVSVVSQAGQIATAANAVITGMMSGGMGYLAAADALTGVVFGNKGPDVGALRHEQIMNALTNIQEGINEVKATLEEIKQGLAVIIQGQQKLFESIVDVSKQIERNHEQVMSELTKIRIDIGIIADIVNEISNKTIEACFVFRDRLQEKRYSLTQSVSFIDMTSIFSEYGADCLSGLKQKISNPLQFGTYHLKRYTKPGSGNEEFLSQVYYPLKKFAMKCYIAKNQDAYIRAFLMPVGTLDAVFAKRSEIFGEKPPDYNPFRMNQSWNIRSQLLDEPLSPVELDRHVSFLLFAHPFFEMQDALKNKKVEEILAFTSGTQEGLALLKTALDLTEAAMMHHVMLSGDVMLEDLDRIWIAGSEGSAARPGESAADATMRVASWAELSAMLPQQTLLRQNLILYAVAKEVQEKSNSRIYALGYNVTHDPAYMRAALPSARFNLVYIAPPAGQPAHPDPVHLIKSTGWHINIDGQKYPLPTPEQLTDGKLVTSPILATLLSTRNKIATEIAGYETGLNLSQYQQKQLRRATWSSVNATIK